MSNPFAGAIASMTTFDRRASRTEYAIGIWAIGSVYAIAAFIAVGVISTSSQGLGGAVGVIMLTGCVVGLILLTKNRFNDFDASGWWQLIPFAAFIALFIPGTPGQNKYGVRS